MANLYQRLGGVDAIACIVDDAIDRHAANPALAPRFRGRDLPLLKKLSLQCLSALAWGAPAHGEGGRAVAYAGMDFGASELQALVSDVVAAMQEQGLGPVEVGALADLLLAMSCDEASDRPS